MLNINCQNTCLQSRYVCNAFLEHFYEFLKEGGMVEQLGHQTCNPEFSGSTPTLLPCCMCSQ